MSEVLKKGWAKVAFGDVVQQVKDIVEPELSGLDRYIAGEHMDTDDLKIRRWGIIGDGYLGPAFHMRFKPGHVLYGSRRTYLRKVAVPDFEGITANTTYVIKTKDPNILLQEFLPYIMQTESFHEHSIKQSKGSVNPYINFSDIAWYEFALPPLEEQRRIVKVLRSSNRLNDRMSRLEHVCFSFLVSYSANLFESYVNGDKLMVQFGDICSKKPQSGIYKSEIYRGKGVPMVNMGELFAYDIIHNNIKMDKVVVDEKELSRYKLTPNDLLFGRRSVVLEGAGKCVMVGDLSTPTVFESSLLRATIDNRLADSRFIFEWFHSPFGNQQIKRIVSFTTVSGVAGSDLLRVKVPLPELSIQKELAKRLSMFRKSITIPNSRLLKSKELTATFNHFLMGSG